MCSKIMKHIIHSNMKHLNSHHILRDYHYGFQKQRSCESQLITTISDRAWALNDKEQVDLSLLDFMKAFDKVPHRRLLQKIEKCSGHGSILEHRTLQVELEGQTSSSINVSSRVPRGTTLGPLLLCIYINDLAISVELTARLFADDAIIPEDKKQGRYRHPRRRPRRPPEMGKYVTHWIEPWQVQMPLSYQ